MDRYILLIAVLIVLIFGAVKGYTRGFLRIAVWFAGLIAILFIVTKISPYVSDFLMENTKVYDNLKEKIVAEYEVNNEDLDSFGFPELIKDSINTNNTSEIYEKLAVTLFSDYIAGYLSSLAIRSGTFVGLFVLLAVVQFILMMTIKIIEKIPVLRTVNRLLGMATGITISLVVVWLFFLAVMMFFGRSFGSWVFAQVGASRFLTYLFNNNILFNLI